VQVLGYGTEVARFHQQDILASGGAVGRPYGRLDQYDHRYLLWADDGSPQTLTVRGKDQVVAVAPLADLYPPEFGGLAPFLGSVVEVTVRESPDSNLEFLRFVPYTVRLQSHCSALRDVSGLRYLRGLRSLLLDYPTCRLDVLGELASLEDLYLDGWPAGAQSIFGLRRLVRLVIRSFSHADLASMAAWSQLRYLRLGRGRLQELAGVPPGIRHLELSYQPKLTSIQAASTCGELRELILHCCRPIHSIEGLERCRRLRFLSLRKLGPVLDLSPLQGMEELERLDLAEKAITEDTDLEGIYGHPKLRDLCISKKAKLDVDRLLADSPNCQIRLTSN
jgi:hypothetical protein